MLQAELTWGEKSYSCDDDDDDSGGSEWEGGWMSKRWR